MQQDTFPHSKEPYLSVVVTARNDDHGGNLLCRMQVFVNVLIAQAKLHKLPLELIVVEWNPPVEKPPLIEALSWPEDLRPCQVRFIVVPAELHHRFRHAKALPLYQMIAKNVGIRRARGRFILATNIDIIFSNELFQFIAQRRLELGKMFRVDRYDVMPDVPVDSSIEEQLHYCQTHLIRVNTREGTFPVGREGRRLLERDDIAEVNSGITLGRGWYPLEGGPKQRYRWILNNAEIFVNPARTLVLDLEPGPGVGYAPFRLQVTDAHGDVVLETTVSRRQKIRVPVSPSTEEEVTLQLRVLGGGQSVIEDPRILNFRVFSCHSEVADRVLGPAGSAGESPEPEVIHPSGLRQPIPAAVSGTERCPGLRSRIRHATDPLRVSLPLSGFVLRRWQPRLEGRALSVSADPSWRRWLPRRSVRVPRYSDPLAADVDLLWGRGWYPSERFKGETFRWTQNDAQWVLRPREGPIALLRVQIEPGPAAGYQPFHLQVRDARARCVATAVVNYRQWIVLPIPGQPNRSSVLTLHALVSAPPKEVPHDPRQMFFRVFRCEWVQARPDALETTDENSGLHPEIFSPWTPLGRESGILLGEGWSQEPWRDRGTWLWSATDGAEIVVRAPSGAPQTAELDLEACESRLDLLVKDAEDRVLTRFSLTGRQRLLCDLRLESDELEILRLVSQTEFEGTRAGRALLRLHGARWQRDQADVPPPPEIRLPTIRPLGPVQLHTNACGDFTLLAREHWWDLRGYPEFELFSMHIDSVFCYAAHYGGAPEVVLDEPMRIYHIEHASGSGFTPEGQGKLFERIAAKGLSWINYHEVLQLAAHMRRLQSPMIFNRENWGFGSEDLPEQTVPSQTPEFRAKIATSDSSD